MCGATNNQKGGLGPGLDFRFGARFARALQGAVVHAVRPQHLRRWLVNCKAPDHVPDILQPGVGDGAFGFVVAQFL